MDAIPAADDPVAQADLESGARNLLQGCAGVRPGDKLLIVLEPADSRHYEAGLTRLVADQAAALGAEVSVLETSLIEGPEGLPPDVETAIGAADHTIFLSRLGDQVRFTNLPGAGSKTMCHTLELEHLASAFGRLPYGFLAAAHDRLVAHLAEARRYTIRCPLGTDLSLSCEPRPQAANDLGAFSLKTFPVMIVPTIPAARMEGTLVASLALSSTGIREYEDHVLPLPSPVAFEVRAGRIVGMMGEPGLTAAVEAHLRRVAAFSGGDPFALNSWHTGINPATTFSRPALGDLDRWTSVSFGSPRYSHFHLCGQAPGDVSIKVFDPTIVVDGEPIWSDGYFVYLERPEIQALAASFGVDTAELKIRRDIGV